MSGCHRTIDQLGRITLPNLPDGVYTVTITPTTGYALITPQSLNLRNGGALSLALQPTGQLSGAVYEDWDGDGQRGADEALIITPIPVTIAGLGSQPTTLGMFRFWNVANGTYSLTSSWLAIKPTTANPAIRSALGLPSVPGGEVRGTAWLDANNDGLRQAWEAPLAGMSVTLAGRTALTDATGRYAFNGIVAGTYTPAVTLPHGLKAGLTPVTVRATRWTAVGIAATSGGQLYLPLVAR